MEHYQERSLAIHFTAGWFYDRLTYTATDANGYESVGAAIFHVRDDLQPLAETYTVDFGDSVQLEMKSNDGIRPIRFSEPITPTSGNISGSIPNFTYTFDENFRWIRNDWSMALWMQEEQRLPIHGQYRSIR